MAKALLGFERIFLGSPKQSTFALQRLERLARHLGLWHDPLFARRFAALSMDLDSHKALYERSPNACGVGRASARRYPC